MNFFNEFFLGSSGEGYQQFSSGFTQEDEREESETAQGKAHEKVDDLLISSCRSVIKAIIFSPDLKFWAYF